MTHDSVETANQKMVENTNSALDKSVESLSPNVQSRLQQARENAVNHQIQAKSFANLYAYFIRQSFTTQAMEAGMAFCLLALVIVPFISSIKETTIEPSLARSNSVIDEFILLSNFDDTELEVIEDIEFAYWLSQELEDEDDIDRPYREAFYNNAAYKHFIYNNAAQHNG